MMSNKKIKNLSISFGIEGFEEVAPLGLIFLLLHFITNRSSLWDSLSPLGANFL